MKKVDTTSCVIVACMVITAIISLFFLPEEIAVQWNARHSIPIAISL